MMVVLLSSFDQLTLVGTQMDQNTVGVFHRCAVGDVEHHDAARIEFTEQASPRFQVKDGLSPCVCAGQSPLC